MDSINTKIKEFADKLSEARKPVGIKGKFQSFVKHIRFRDEYELKEELEELMDDFYRESSFCLYSLNGEKDAGYYAFPKDDGGLLLIIDVDSISESADITIMLPLIGNLEQIESLQGKDLQFWGAHLAVIRTYRLDDLLDEFGSIMTRIIQRAEKTFHQYKTQLEPDHYFSFFVMQRLSFITDGPIYYNPRLARVLLKKIRNNIDELHMPRNIRNAHVNLGQNVVDNRNDLQNTDILISKLFNEALVTTITDIAWYFLNKRYEKEAKALARIAFELGDPEAEAVLNWEEEEIENDSLYESEIRNHRHFF